MSDVNMLRVALTGLLTAHKARLEDEDVDTDSEVEAAELALQRTVPGYGAGWLKREVAACG